MKIDDSFKKPGAVPFKWEIRPGVPKLQSQNPLFYDPQFQVKPEKPKHQHKQSPRKNIDHHREISSPKLKPPPSGFSFNHAITLNPNENSIKTSPRTRSFRLSLGRPDIVSPSGCFASPLVKRKGEKKKRNNGHFGAAGPESEYYSDNDVPSRWSVSSRKSTVSVSPLSSSFASYISSPRLVNDDDDDDAEWATFGLF